MLSVRAQPLLAVRNVKESARFYSKLLGGKGAHGGDLYEQIEVEGELVLQLHAWDQEDHPNLSNPSIQPRGHGVLVWFHISRFQEALAAAKSLEAEIVEEAHVNPNSLLNELWLRDPDGYVIVLSSENE